MKKPQKYVFPKYPDRDYLDGLKHKVLAEKRLNPEYVLAVSQSIRDVADTNINRIRALADIRREKNRATALTLAKQYKTEQGGCK